jgi:hypothetical protein
MIKTYMGWVPPLKYPGNLGFFIEDNQVIGQIAYVMSKANRYGPVPLGLNIDRKSHDKPLKLVFGNDGEQVIIDMKPFVQEPIVLPQSLDAKELEQDLKADKIDLTKIKV